MRLLYLAYAYPPSPAIGAVRAWNTARWLARLGWSVTVVTPAPSVWRAPEPPRPEEPGVRRLDTGHAWPMLAPDQVRWRGGRLLGGACRVAARRLGLEAAAGWERSAWRACSGLSAGDFDLVLATGSPFVSFRLARRLGRRLRCPFVLDYRDPWTGNPHKASAPRAEEADLLRACAAATVVSPSWALLLGESFGAREKVHVVSNGYDPELYDGVPAGRFGHFSVVYAGTLYPPKRVLDPVLSAFAGFSRERPEARFHYYGDHGGPVLEAARRLGTAASVVVHGRVSRGAALRAQKGADLLVVVASVEEDGPLSDRGVVTGKVFDCMGLGRPALVVAPRRSDLYGVVETAGGMGCFTGSQVPAMTRYIAEVAAGRTPPPRDRGAYRWDRIARKLDLVLRAAAGSLS